MQELERGRNEVMSILLLISARRGFMCNYCSRVIFWVGKLTHLGGSWASGREVPPAPSPLRLLHIISLHMEQNVFQLYII